MIPDTVTVWISTPEYECPGHYPWGVYNPQYKRQTYFDYFEIPRETCERWLRIQDEWEQMNEEMHQISGII